MIDPNRICYRCMLPLAAADAPCSRCGATRANLRNEDDQLPIGSILAGKYLVGCALGQGGFGITYVGWELNIGRKLAVKEYYPDGFVKRDLTNQSAVRPFTGDREAFFQKGRAKFVEEAQTLARFASDPGIVSVHDFFNENGTAYIVMDYVEGCTLKQLAKERGGKLPADEVLRYLLPVMDSLEKVHAAGMLHRDISPDNIMITPEGRAVLLDFGAARQISALGERSNTINVKHGFAPEEQYRTHGEQGPWTDIYALCATIYRLTTGVTPPNAVDRLSGEVAEPNPPSAFGVRFTQRQQEAVMRGLSVRRRDRQQSMGELRTDLSARSQQSAETGAQREPSVQEQEAEHGAESEPVVRPLREESEPENTCAPVKTLAILLIAALVVVPLAFAGWRMLRGASGQALTAEVATPETTAALTPEPTAKPTATPSPAPISAAEVSKEYKYETRADGNIVLTKYIGTGTELVIPNNVDGVPVVEIGYYAFYECSSLTGITIPDSVTSIGDYAFWLCVNLTSITIPDGVTSIGDGVFLRCYSLTSITIPDGVTSIGRSAFAWCSSLTGITIPDGVTRIGSGAFCGTPWLSDQPQKDGWVSLNHGVQNVYVGTQPQVVIPPSFQSFDLSNNEHVEHVTIQYGVTSIGDYAFFGCDSLTSITIPDSVTSIGAYAFCRCDSLTSITIPDSLTSIGDGAFSNCSVLTSITIPDGVTSIGSWAFYECSSLTGITIPDGVTSIGDGVFFRCDSLTSITIPDGVISIGYRAFYRCSSLTSITIPDNVTSIGVGAFSGTPWLSDQPQKDGWVSLNHGVQNVYVGTQKQISIPHGFRSFDLSGNLAVERVTIPDSVTGIGDRAFWLCFSLTSITIPDSVTSIGYRAFSDCSALTSITIPAPVTEIGDDAFNGCKKLTIHCPAGSDAAQYAMENELKYKLS